jgi:hypothetical protein
MQISPRFGKTYTTIVPTHLVDTPSIDTGRCAKVKVGEDVALLSFDCSKLKVSIFQRAADKTPEREKDILRALLEDPSQNLPISRPVAQKLLNNLLTVVDRVADSFASDKSSSANEYVHFDHQF